MSLLSIRNLSMRFGGLAAISNLEMDIEDGEIRGLIGPNGAGKTTLFNVVSGVYKPSGGAIRFRSSNISTLKPHQTARLGIVRTFQSITLFRNFTVIRNVLVGGHLHAGYGYWRSLFDTPKNRELEQHNLQRAHEILEFMGLLEYRNEPAGSLPHGHQRALGIAIALAARPKILLLDEPCTGMNTEETGGMVDLIARIREGGVTILLIEHDMKVVMGLCDTITVLNFGTKIAEGAPDAIQKNAAVHEAYLGSGLDAA